MDEFEFDTLAIRAGHQRSDFQEQSEAIFATSSFVFNSAEEAAARFAGDDDGFFYSRVANPTIKCFQDRLAALEGGRVVCCHCIGNGSNISDNIGSAQGWRSCG